LKQGRPYVVLCLQPFGSREIFVWTDEDGGERRENKHCEGANSTKNEQPKKQSPSRKPRRNRAAHSGIVIRADAQFKDSAAIDLGGAVVSSALARNLTTPKDRGIRRSPTVFRLVLGLYAQLIRSIAES
jgi:hypothetical protein